MTPTHMHAIACKLTALKHMVGLFELPILSVMRRLGLLFTNILSKGFPRVLSLEGLGLVVFPRGAVLGKARETNSPT